MTLDRPVGKPHSLTDARPNELSRAHPGTLYRDPQACRMEGGQGVPLRGTNASADYLCAGLKHTPGFSMVTEC